MRHGKLPRVQRLASRAWLYGTVVTAMLACGQCRVCGVDGLGSAGSLNVTFARNSRNSRVCTDPKGSIATAGAGIDVMAPVPYFYPVDATGASLPECISTGPATSGQAVTAVGRTCSSAGSCYRCGRTSWELTSLGSAECPNCLNCVCARVALASNGDGTVIEQD
ncbi:hypothetical protein CVIRNUC_010979 [Coccomyxa viridis]|uniref:Extracellular protein n=1 Tax=Coccomyxa viridis TaxID=1274662 RepID=A0AAV1IKG3_9CHLO|nr:hypothetical protein CVIRNUC_010979 [Coccomyxa viridis]